MEKKLINAIAAVMLLAAFAVPANAEDISAESFIVADADTGKILYEKEPDTRMQIASTTKIMTALVVLENCSLYDHIKIKDECARVEGSSIYLHPGETVTVETLLYGMLLESGNDAAYTLADYTAGSIQEFADMMNKTAAELGCENTHFMNPHGLDEKDHYSTASDLARITAAAMKNEKFREIVSTRTISIDGRSFKNHNKLLWSYDGTLGVKTGYTKSSGRSLVSCVERNGMTLICVTLDDPNDWDDHKALYDRAFSEWENVTACRAGETIYEIPVVSGLKSTVKIRAEETLSFIAKKDSDVEITVYLPEHFYAPVNEGDTAGSVKAVCDGEEMLSAKLVFGESVGLYREEKPSGWDKLKTKLFSLIDRGMNSLGYSPEQ